MAITVLALEMVAVAAEMVAAEMGLRAGLLEVRVPLELAPEARVTLVPVLPVPPPILLLLQLERLALPTLVVVRPPPLLLPRLLVCLPLMLMREILLMKLSPRVRGRGFLRPRMLGQQLSQPCRPRGSNAPRAEASVYRR
jgi:hypothetical protein